MKLRAALIPAAVLAIGPACNMIVVLAGGEGIACQTAEDCPTGMRCGSKQKCERAGSVDSGGGDGGGGDGGIDVGLTWVPIPGGTYQMGCSPNDTQCGSGESPRHAVTITPFELTATEVTQAQYRAATDSNPSARSDCPACPVEQVTWQQAKDFCLAVGGRLPSEAEWEYAARAGEPARYSCGSDSACLAGIAWDVTNSDTGSGAQTHPAGVKAATAFGLFDMLGNVAEWCADCWHADYTEAPTTGNVWSDGANEDCGFRLQRGGSFLGGADDLRVSARLKTSPDTGSYVAGMRCAR